MLLKKIVNAAQYHFYTLLDEHYYTDPEYQPVEATSEYKSIIQNIINDNEDWEIIDSGMWITVKPRIGKEVPVQGFKFHISAYNIDDFITCLKKIAPICKERQIELKIVRDSFWFNYLSSKACPIQWAFKFLTIYPHDQSSESLIDLAYSLRDAIHVLEGPDIITDTNIEKSLYYRYGSFKQELQLQENGTQIQFLNIDGEDIPDYTEKLPKNIIDPFLFLQQQDHTTEVEDTELLNDQYNVQEVISMGPHSAVYIAIEIQTNETVAIKHAFPRRGYLKEEEKIIRHLNENDCEATPKLINFFSINNTDDDGGTFLVTNFIQGTAIIDIPKNQRVKYLLPIAQALEKIHNHNVIHGDISPYNIIIDEGTSVAYIIDYELSSILPHTREIDAGTPRYTPNNRTGGMSDDIYSLAATFFFCLYGFPPLPKYKKILNRRNDIDPSIQTLIIKCLSEDPDKRPTINQVVKVLTNNTHTNRKPQQIENNYLKKENIAPTVKALMQGLNSCRNHETDPERLYPGIPEQFMTNPLSYSIGAAGIIYARYICDSQYNPKKDIKGILNHPSLNTTEMPPGIAIGLSGISIVLNEIGYQDEARTTLLQATSHPMIVEERISFNLNYGLTGVGIACFYIAENIDDIENRFMDIAIKIRDRILNIPEGQITADMCLFLSKFQDDTCINIVENTIHTLLSKPVSTIEQCLSIIRLLCNTPNLDENKYKDYCSQLIDYLFQNSLSYTPRTLCVILDAILDARDTFNDNVNFQEKALIVAQRLIDITIEAPKNGASFIPGENLSIIRVSPTNTAIAALTLNRLLKDNLAESKKSSPYFFI